MRKMCSFINKAMLRHLFLFAIVLPLISGKSSEYQLCADPKCEVAISRGTTAMKYASISPKVLSFGQNAQVMVYSKEAGTDAELWGVEIRGKRGFAPKRFIREDQILFKGDLKKVPVTENNDKIKDRPVSDQHIVESKNTESQDNTPGESHSGNEKPNHIHQNIVEKQETAKEISSGDSKISIEKDIDSEKLSSQVPEMTLDTVQPDKSNDSSPIQEDIKGNSDVSGSNNTAEEKEDEEGDDDEEEEVNIVDDDDDDDDYEEEEGEMRSTTIAPDNTPQIFPIEPVEGYGTAIDTSPDDVHLIENATVIENGPLDPIDKLNSTMEINPIASEIKIDTPDVGNEIINDSNEKDLKIEPASPKTNEEFESGPIDPLLLNGNQSQPGDKETINSEFTLDTLNIPSELIGNEVLEKDANLESTQRSDHFPIKANISIDIEGTPMITPNETIDLPIENSTPGSLDEEHAFLVNDSFVEVAKTDLPSTTVSSPIDDNSHQLEGDAITNDIKIADGLKPSSNTVEINVGEPLANEAENTPTETDVSTEATTDTPNEYGYIDFPTTEMPTFHPYFTKQVKEEELTTPEIQPNVEAIFDSKLQPNIVDSADSEMLPSDNTEEISTAAISESKSEYDHELKGDIPKPSYDEMVDENVNPSILFQIQEMTAKTVGKLNIFNFGFVPNEAKSELSDGYCDMKSCPLSEEAILSANLESKDENSQTINRNCGSSLNYEQIFDRFLANLLSMTDLIICMAIVAVTTLTFTILYYCLGRRHRVNELVDKLNYTERTLMNAQKQCALLDSDLLETRYKLTSIEDNSFGSNEMVIAIRGDLIVCEKERDDLQAQVGVLEKELENAAEAGLELNRMVSELLNNQHGSDSIISSVEELQSQLNEQQETIHSINSLLAEKSRENSELLVELSELKERMNQECGDDRIRIASLEEKLVDSENKAASLEVEWTQKMQQLIQARDSVIHNLESQIESIQLKERSSSSKVEALEECLKTLGSESGGDTKLSRTDLARVLNVTSIKAKLLAANKEKEAISERFTAEIQSKHLLEEQISAITTEVQRLRAEFNNMEKEKMEAQTKLGILTNYFKEKEAQLQRDLSAKEAECMQQLGESTSTVDRIRAQQDEIQSLKSQNESLRNEIEIQEKTHKAQILTLENRSHDNWITARQTERRLEEMRSETASLRQKLTAMAGSVTGPLEGPKQAHSPIQQIGAETSTSPVIPPFLPPFPPFMSSLPPPGFIPPPPFDMRPPPLGRLMSPPPGGNPSSRFSPHIMDDRERYSPRRYSPDRYDQQYSVYETETDISPPPSPPHHHSRHSSGGSGTYNSLYRSPQQASQSVSKKYGKGKPRSNGSFSDRSDNFEKY